MTIALSSRSLQRLAGVHPDMVRVVRAAAMRADIDFCVLEGPIEWGGDWRRFADGPHWQLPWGQYP